MVDSADGCLMSKCDYEILNDLRNEVWTWRREVQDPVTLLALSAMDQKMAREEAGNVLTLALENYNFMDGWRVVSEARISICDDGISLQGMQVEFGDHQSETLAFLSADGDFSGYDVQAWLDAKHEDSDALTANIDDFSIGV